MIKFFHNLFGVVFISQKNNKISYIYLMIWVIISFFQMFSFIFYN